MVAVSSLLCSMDARVSMSKASSLEVAQLILGACATGLRNVLKTPFIIIASPLCFRFFPLVSQAIKRDLGSASRYAACCFYEVGAVSAQAADISQLVGDTLPGF